MEKPKKRRLGEILLEDGILTKPVLEQALAYQKENGGLIGQILVQQGHLSEEELVSVLARQLKMPFLALEHYSINMDAARNLEETFCRQHCVLSFDADDNKVFMALGDPLNDLAVAEVEKKLNLKPQVFLAAPSEIMMMLDLVYTSNNPGTFKKAG